MIIFTSFLFLQLYIFERKINITHGVFCQEKGVNCKMQVAICDDEAGSRQELKKFILDYKYEKRIAVDICEFENGDALLSCKDVFDMVFVDYQMPGLNGLETAHLLRQKNSICSIIFVTSYPQFMIDSFEVQPFRFFIKPLEYIKLKKAMDDYIKQQHLLNPITIIEYGEQFTIDSKSIIYIEGSGKYSLIRTLNHTYKCSKTLSGLLDILPKHCFYRIHKSYIVNLYCIKKVAGNEITLNNSEKAIVGRNHLKDFKIVYRCFIKNYYVRL